MSRIKAFAFLLAYLVPALMPLAAWLGERTGWPGAMAWSPLFALFVLLPAIDHLLGHDPANVPRESERAVAANPWFRALTLLALPVQLALVAWSGQRFVHGDLPAAGMAGWLLSQGVVGGILAINIAHELIHREEKLEQWVGGALLASVGYQGFKIEHVRGHHVHVSTPEDASSARRGQSLWAFLPAALARNTRVAWRLEADRLRKLGRSPLSWRNELLGWTALWLALAAAFFLLLGAKGLAFFLLQGLFASVTLEIINYIQHYGLERHRQPDGRYERPALHHSWSSDFLLTNLILFQLPRHADHHASPRRRYPILRHSDGAPQLPWSYAAMFVLALVPPLWRRVIDPRVRALQPRT